MREPEGGHDRKVTRCRGNQPTNDLHVHAARMAGTPVGADVAMVARMLRLNSRRPKEHRRPRIDQLLEVISVLLGTLFSWTGSRVSAGK